MSAFMMSWVKLLITDCRFLVMLQLAKTHSDVSCPEQVNARIVGDGTAFRLVAIKHIREGEQV